MEAPLFCVENLFDDLVNPAHVVTANEESAGKEVWHVATGRRSVDDYWTPTTKNQAASMKVDCATAKTADFIAVDRGSTLEGKTITLETSADDFATAGVTVFTATIPSASTAGTALDAANGAYTEEGAWVKRFPSTSARYWRLTVAAAVDYKPQIVGLWLAEAWAPGEQPVRPFDEDGSAGAWGTRQNEYGWSAYSSTASPRGGTLSIRTRTLDDTAARLFLAAYRRGRPTWYVSDPAAAERAFLFKVPQGSRVEAPYPLGWAYRVVGLPYVEHQPEIDD